MAAIHNLNYSLDDNPDDLVCIRDFLRNLSKEADRYRYGEELISDEINSDHQRDYLVVSERKR